MIQNKQILINANAAITNGDYEGFLSHCTEDTEWTFVGEQILQGKQAVRQYMAEMYVEPPKFQVEHLIAEDDFVTAIGTINIKDKAGKPVEYSYCDVWRLRDGKLHELKAFVIAKEEHKKSDDVADETVRGSGFTYDESRHETDESIPIDKVKDEEIVKLPDLGKPNRP